MTVFLLIPAFRSGSQSTYSDTTHYKFNPRPFKFNNEVYIGLPLRESYIAAVNLKKIDSYKFIKVHQDTVIQKLQLNLNSKDSIIHSATKYSDTLEMLYVREIDYTEKLQHKIKQQKKTNTFMGIGLAISIVLGIIF